jgi:hypothetical protein
MGSAFNRPLEPGSIVLEFEGITIPSLSLEQRTVGFDGIKEEDLNKVPLLGRGRIVVGLPWGFHVTGGWVPPLEIRGVKGNLFSLSAGRELPLGAGWTASARAFAQDGVIEGAFTCYEDVVAFPPASPGNPWACEELSEDEYSLTVAGGEVQVARVIASFGAPRIHAGAAAASMDAEFQVSALRSGFLDRTLLRADGTVLTYSAGARWELASGITLGGEVVYAPLSVDRHDGEGSVNDPLLNVHVVLGFRAR